MLPHVFYFQDFDLFMIEKPVIRFQDFIRIYKCIWSLCNFFGRYIFSLYLYLMCVCTRAHACAWDWMLSFNHAGLRHQTQVVNLGGRHLCPLNNPTSPVLFLSNKFSYINFFNVEGLEKEGSRSLSLFSFLLRSL